MRSNKLLWGTDVLVLFSLTMVVWALLYLVSAGYPEYAHLDPTVVVATQQWMHGRPLYAPTGGDAHYSLIYGPLNFLFTAAGLSLFSDPVLGGKFAGVFVCLLALGLFIWAARRTMPWREALIASGLLSMQSLILHTFIFGMAANPTLELAAVLGILSLSFNGNVRVGIVALATVLALGSKLHGPLYVLPAWTMLLIEGGWRRCLVCGVVTVVASLALFLIPGISLAGYADWLQFVAHHRLVRRLVTHTLAWEVNFGAPVLLYFLVFRWWRSTPELDRIGLSLLVAMGLVLVPASKEGAGYHHAWAFIPWIAWFTLKWVHSMRELSIGPRMLLVARVGVFVWIANLAFHVWQSSNAINYYFTSSHWLVYLEKDVKDVMERHPGVPVQMGFGGDQGYWLTSVRPYVYQRDTPYIVDAGSVMDYTEAGGSLAPDLKYLLSRREDLWLIPKDNVPFSMVNWYDPRPPLFGTAFPKEFRENYTKVESTKFFDVYRSNAALGRSGR